MKKAGIIITALLLVFTSCKKGDPGPPGPPGPQGPQGPAGNANIITTNTITLNSFTYDAPNDIYYSSYSASGITQEVVDKGLVFVYLKGNSSSNWEPLPLRGVNVADDYLWYEIYTGGLKIKYEDFSSNTTNDPSGWGWIIKVIIVPPSMVKPNVNYNIYEQVKNAYNIKD